MSISRTMSARAQTKRKTPEIGIMENYSPLKLYKIPTTSTKPKVNVFRSFRPKQGEVLDYNISETFLEMEHKGTQINYRETKAEYVPAPEEYLRKRQKRKRIVYSHGGPPQWKFIDEIWLEKQTELQKIYKEKFKEFGEKRKKRVENIFASKHALIQYLVGPEWYQELSPRQIKIVDQLHDCIQKDMKTNTNCCTKEAIARLGLVCRPNQKKILLALKYCCGCPVEFLFILYQLLDPKRKHYSVSDRLLLSSVVHLTMTQTLRELHIRIPSPVKKKKIEKRNTPGICAKKYVSPYLVPYTFKPERPKFEGIYRKKHIQCPESPYFSYLEFLRIEQNNAQDYSELELRSFDDVERELIYETIEAQKLYNEMHSTTDSKLLKPTVLESCGDFEEYKKELVKMKDHKGKKVTLPGLMVVAINQTQCTCPSETEIQEESVNEQNSCICNTKPAIPPLSTFCTECSLTRKQKNVNSAIAGIAIIGCKNIVPIHGGVYCDLNCYCKLQFEGEMELTELRKKLEKHNEKFLINGVVITQIGPIYALSTALWSGRLKKLLKRSYMANNKEDKSAMVHNNEENLLLANKSEEKSQNISSKELLSQQEQVNYGEYCECDAEKESQDELISSETSLENTCQCAREIDIFLKNKCTCEICNLEQRRKDAIFILTGIKDCENTPKLNIVYGIQNRQCKCIETYLDKMTRVEEYRKRCKAVYELKKKGLKYAVSGVTNTEKGPIYQISGTRPPVECICKEVFDEQKQLKEEIQRFPKMPPTGRIKYEIGGVKELFEENIFLINQALECDECYCERLYKEFMTEHDNCWEAYQTFLKTVETSKKEYLTECKDHNQVENAQKNNESIKESDEKECLECFELSSDFRKPSHNNDKPRNEIFHISKRTIHNQDNYCQCFDPEYSEQNPTKYKRGKNSRRNNSKSEEKECSCECNKSDSLKFDSSYAINLSSINYDKKEPKKEVKRFILLRKIPRNIRTQRSILKDALERMATDGFALAKLPDAHKLPHFKLWMELRSGKKWKQEDRRYYELFSLFAWEHTNICYESVKVPRVELPPEVEKKITWNHAEYFRNLTDNKKYNFHRKVKQQLINKTREFFPTVFTYELPTKQYKKCFFAYLPNKEEDAIIPS